VDDLERSAMHDGSPVRFWEKLVSRGSAAAVAVIGGLIAVGGIGQGFFMPELLPGLLVGAAGVTLGGLLALLGVAGGVARTVVTDKALHVQAGLRFLDIPLEDVREVQTGLRERAYRARHDVSTLPIGTPTVTVRFTQDGEERGETRTAPRPEWEIPLCEVFYKTSGSGRESAPAKPS